MLAAFERSLGLAQGALPPVVYSRTQVGSGRGRGSCKGAARPGTSRPARPFTCRQQPPAVPRNLPLTPHPRLPCSCGAQRCPSTAPASPPSGTPWGVPAYAATGCWRGAPCRWAGGGLRRGAAGWASRGTLQCGLWRGGWQGRGWSALARAGWGGNVGDASLLDREAWSAAQQSHAVNAPSSPHCRRRR